MSPTRPALGGRLTVALVALGFAVTITGCSALTEPAPAPTPADFQGIATEIVRRGIAIDNLVSGDAGCNDKVLYIFRNRDAYERLRSAIDECARSFVTDPETFESIESSPFVLAGQGPWAPEFKATLREALTEASGTGD